MNHSLFVHLGLLTDPNFLPPDLCAELRTEILTADGEPASVRSGQYALIDEDIRRVSMANIAKETRLKVRKYLDNLLPKLESHFNVTLAGFEKPNFLMYAEGCFFKQHRDSADDPHAEAFMQERKISVVIFLNNETEAPSPNSYGGGQLILYSLLDDPQWNCGFPLTGAEGLLLAFRSDQQHEVTPVKHGNRFTIVTWFY